MHRHLFPFRPARKKMLAALVGLGALGGCDSLPGLEGAGGADAPAATQTTDAATGAPRVQRIEERDVERPDLYSLSARGLWDGRFSLGGRWVAVKEDVNAERVRITNKANGKTIEGALFKREVDLPGPPIMVSMDAAVALGMQPGSPVDMDVVVVRTETIEIPVPEAAAPVDPVAETPQEAETPEFTGGGALEASVLDALETSLATVPARPEPAPEPAPETAPDAGADPGAAVAPVAAAPIATGVIETTPVAAPTPDAPSSGATSSDAGTNIQVAGGTNREGAEAVAKRLNDASIPARVVEGTSQGKPFYRVMAGPFAGREAFDAGLAKVRALGYSDAFAAP